MLHNYHINADIVQRGRFDQSFVVRMIRDFFLVLLLVAVVELGLRFVIVVSDFYTVEKKATEVAAERLASNVRQIMLNTGGPIAARAFYPILERGHAELGLHIAIEPSEETTRSIEEVFGFTPQGIPAVFPAGAHQAATAAIRAEDFCLGCHTKAAPGGVLGTVTVRNYLTTHVVRWWDDVRLTAIMSLVKILLHTVVLFFLLRSRMEPLLSLRAVVAGLARGGSDLSLRALAKSTDEFGELSADLNHFLDRIGHIVEDLRGVLGKVIALNHAIEAIRRRLGSGLDRLGSYVADVQGHARTAAARAAPNPSVQECAEKGLGALAGEIRTFERLVGEMAVLEEKMNRIAETGQTLIDRLHASPEAHRPNERTSA